MARPKANFGTVSYAGLRSEFLLDEYINARPENVLPEAWGPSLSWRRYNAGLLARFCEHPDLLKVPKSVFDKQPDLHSDLSRQVLFAQLFATEPIYFLSFVQYFRDADRRLPQAETVAILLLSEHRALMEPSGETAQTDKEIADTLAKRADLGLAGLHPSVIGKARKLIRNWREKIQDWKSDRYTEEYLPVLGWLNNIHKAAENHGGDKDGNLSLA